MSLAEGIPHFASSRNVTAAFCAGRRGRCCQPWLHHVDASTVLPPVGDDETMVDEHQCSSRQQLIHLCLYSYIVHRTGAKCLHACNKPIININGRTTSHSHSHTILVARYLPSRISSHSVKSIIIVLFALFSSSSSKLLSLT